MANSEREDMSTPSSAGRAWAGQETGRARARRPGRARRAAVGAVAALSMALSATALATGAFGGGFEIDGKSWASFGSITVKPGPSELPMGKSWAAADPTPPVIR